MPTTQNTKTVTDMREDANGLLDDVQRLGLIYLFQHSDPKAVVLSIEEFYRFQEMTEDYIDELDATKLANEPRGELISLSKVVEKYKKTHKKSV